VVAAERTEWTTDGSVGLVFEKNTGFDVNTGGALIAGEKLTHKFNDTTKLVHAASGLVTAVARHLDLTAEFLHTYKARPTNRLLKKSDQSVVLSIVYKY